MNTYPTAFTLGLQLTWHKNNPKDLQREYAARDAGLVFGLMVQCQADHSIQREMIYRLNDTFIKAHHNEVAQQELKDLNDKLGLNLDLSHLDDDTQRWKFLDIAGSVINEIAKNREFDQALRVNLTPQEREGTVWGYAQIQRQELIHFRDTMQRSAEGVALLPEGTPFLPGIER